MIWLFYLVVKMAACWVKGFFIKIILAQVDILKKIRNEVFFIYNICICFYEFLLWSKDIV